MIKKIIIPIILFLSLHSYAQRDSRQIDEFVNEIDKEIPQLLNDFRVPGAAIAIIENGKVILQKGYGFADVEKKVIVSERTGFNIASISKTVSAWGVMKLVKEGKIELDTPAEKYLTRWQIPSSEFKSSDVTIRRLLSHTAGLSLHGYPGWSPKDSLPTIEESLNGKNNGPGRVEIIFEPGTKYKYSGGGYTILQLIIEEVTGQKFEDYMHTEILNPLGMNNSSFRIDSNIIKASASEYDSFGELIDFELFTAKAAAGLHTTIEDFTKFMFANFQNDEQNKTDNHILSEDILELMRTPTPLANYGLGYQKQSIKGTPTVFYGHGGANTGWHTYFRINPQTKDGFVIFTNGGSGQSINRQLYCDWVYWKTGTRLRGCDIKPPISAKLKHIIDSIGIDNLAVNYKNLKINHSDDFDLSESVINQFGYYYLNINDSKKAVAIFKLNVDDFPNSFNVYDSYAEALLENGEVESAIENYKKSVRLNPGNKNGFEVLEKLGVATDDLRVKVPLQQLELLVGEYRMIDDNDWKITIELEDSVLRGNDGGYQYTILPIGDNKFVNSDDGATLEFDTKISNTITLVLFGEYKFKKIK